MGYEVEVTIWTDSTVGKSVASRRGLGKLRHVELKYLWIQDVMKEGRLKVRKVDGANNVADHLTKGKSGSEMARMLRGAGAVVEERRVAAEISGISRRTAEVAD
jgi:hypothetical protein